MADAPVRVELGRATGWFTGATLPGAVDANLAHHRPHEPHRLAEARAAVGIATGTDHRDWHLMRQVHGAEVAVVDAATPLGAELRDGAAAVASAPGRVLVVRPADCLPGRGAGDGAVAVVHAGWRGVVSDVTGRAVGALVDRGEDPGRLTVAIGPAIGGCCYEVGEDVADLVGDVAPGAVVAAPGGRPHVDLPAALVRRLDALGVPPPVLVGPCTRCGPGAWFSHRRDPASGRQAGLVRVPAA
ncbi:MAG: polyphenol oxidase family protein [Nitriliruptoraceae bacterium]